MSEDIPFSTSPLKDCRGRRAMWRVIALTENVKREKNEGAKVVFAASR